MEYSVYFFIALVVITLLLYLFPFIPACHEWKYKTDAKTFRVNFLDRTIVEYSIRLFKEDITTNFSTLLDEYKQKASAADGKLSNGREYYITGKVGMLDLGDENSFPTANKIILLANEAILPDQIQLENKIFALASLATGTNNRLTDVYSEQNILLNNNTIIKKFVYSGGSIIVEKGVLLHCYTKANDKIHFSGAAEFQYLHAPVIEFNPTQAMPTINAVDMIGASIRRQIFEEHFILAKDGEITSHLVIKGPLDIESNCKIIGNIKCYQDVKIASNTSIVGAIISEKNIYIADNCFIQGPLVANGTIRIGENCVIGTTDCKTSVIAPNIYISKGCYATGQILAKTEGIYIG